MDLKLVHMCVQCVFSVAFHRNATHLPGSQKYLAKKHKMLTSGQLYKFERWKQTKQEGAPSSSDTVRRNMTRVLPMVVDFLGGGEEDEVERNLM